jgi:hypothetical protein
MTKKSGKSSDESGGCVLSDLLDNAVDRSADRFRAGEFPTNAGLAIYVSMARALEEGTLSGQDFRRFVFSLNLDMQNVATEQALDEIQELFDVADSWRSGDIEELLQLVRPVLGRIIKMHEDHWDEARKRQEYVD